MSHAKYYLLLLVVCLIWGATPASGKFTVESFSPLMITGMRFALIALILFTWMFLISDKKGLKPSKEVLIVTFAMGFMGVLVHNGMLFLGLTYTTATNTALIESIGPTATTVLAFLFVGERLNVFGWIGIFISCLGALCIVSKGSVDVILSLSFNIGDIYVLICEVAWSAYAVISLRIHGKAGTVAVTAWSGLFGSLLCFAFGSLTGTLHVYEVTSRALWGFSYLTLFSGIVAFIGWNYAVQRVGASKAGVFVYFVPLTGGILGVTLLNEPIHAAEIIGGLVIIAGVVVTVRAKIKLKFDDAAAEASAAGAAAAEASATETSTAGAAATGSSATETSVAGATAVSADVTANASANIITEATAATAMAHGADTVPDVAPDATLADSTTQASTSVAAATSVAAKAATAGAESAVATCISTEASVDSTVVADNASPSAESQDAVGAETASSTTPSTLAETASSTTPSTLDEELAHSVAGESPVAPEPMPQEKDLLKRFPELAIEHNAKLAAKGILVPTDKFALDVERQG